MLPVGDKGPTSSRLTGPTSGAATLTRWLTQLVPDRYVVRQARRGAVGSRDRAALEPNLPWLVTAIREATSGGVSGMVDEYRRCFGSWGFELGNVRQAVTIWHGEDDTWVPMSHARRLASSLHNNTLRVVPSTGHLLPLVVADEILEDLGP